MFKFPEGKEVTLCILGEGPFHEHRIMKKADAEAMLKPVPCVQIPKREVPRKVRVLMKRLGDEWFTPVDISQSFYDKIVALKSAAKPQGQEPLVLT